MFDSLQFLFKVVFIGSVSLIVISNATELKSNESEAKEFAKESSDLLKEFYEDPTDDYILGEASLLVDIANKAKKFDFKNFEDKQLKYEFEEIIKFADDKIMGVDYYAEMVERIIDLRNSNTGGSYFFTEDLDVPKAVVELVIGESINLKEIEFYWKEVRFTSGKWAAENLNFVLDGLKNAANTSVKSVQGRIRPSAQHIEITMFDSIQFVFKVVFIGSVSLIAISNATELKSNECEAKKFAHESSDLLKEFYEDPTDDYILGEASLLVDIANKAKKFDFKNFEDKQLKYEFEEIIKFVDDKIMGVDHYVEMVERINLFMEDLDVHKAVVELVIGESRNSEEIEFYWKELRFRSGKWAAENLDFVLGELKDAASISDVSPLDFWMRYYNLTQFENLMKEIEPLYKELHAFIRNGIRKKYGDSITEPDGLIPAHVFEQVMIQAWSDASTILEEMFPYNDLPQAKYFPYEKFKTMKWADSFYEKLGFTPFPNEVWEADIKKKKEYLLYQFRCRNDIYYKTTKVYLKFCEEMSFSQLIDSYSDMGKLFYAKEMTGLPTYFFSAYNLENAIGKAASLSAFTIHNLRVIGLIQDEDALSSSVEINRLLRKSIESLLRIPIEFVHIKMMEHLLTLENEYVDHKELNKKYWELMEKYVGVKRPTPVEESDAYLDLPPEFYYDIHQNLESRKFDSEILSYQIHKKLCEISGQFPKQPLHRCDISGSKAAGDALKNMMRLGNSKPLKEVMATMFPENPTTRVEGILEYFDPVNKLLLKKNKEANVKPGWKHAKEDLPEP